MREIVNVECKRIMNRKLLGVIFIIGLVFSIVCVINNFNAYNIYDSSGKIIISAKENLTESKKEEHNILLDEKSLARMVNGVDKSNYLYNINALRLLLTTYQDKNISELTQNDLEHFYEQRIESLESEALRPIGIFTEEQIEHLKMKASQMEKPLSIGYAEGWKNLNNDMSDLMLMILFMLSILLLPIFGGTPKSNMSEICSSTKQGKTLFIKAKIITALRIASIVYFLLVTILTVSELMSFGGNGYNLAIQSDPFYFASTWNITFLELYLINIFIGFAATIFMVAIILLFTSITEQIISGGLLTTFFWVVMLSIRNNLFTSYSITHNLSNFFPYNMTNFNRLCRNNEIYQVFGQMVPSWIWISIVVIAITSIIVLVTYSLAAFKLSRKYKVFKINTINLNLEECL